MKRNDVEKIKKLADSSFELSTDYKPQISNATISKICLDLKKMMVKKNLLVCIYEIEERI